MTALIIPDQCKDSFSFESIIKISQRIGEQGINKLDLSNITFIDPYSLVCLLLIGRNYLRSTGEKLAMINVPYHILQYIHRMNFFDYNIFHCNELHAVETLKRSTLSPRLLEIVEIPGKEKESIQVIARVIDTFRKRALKILKHWFTMTMVDYIVTVISEICQNIFEHSMDSGFIAIQTYTVANERIFRMAIVDSGIGIPQSFAYIPEVHGMSNAKLLEAVLTTPLSSKRRFGYGLCQVYAIVEQLKGSIFLRSDNAYISVLHHRKSTKGNYIFFKDDCPPFPGTQFSITLIG